MQLVTRRHHCKEEKNEYANITGMRQSESSFPNVVVILLNSNEQFHDLRIHPGGSTSAGILKKMLSIMIVLLKFK